MKLTELEPKLLRRVTDEAWEDAPTVEQADGIMFLCPKCFKENGGPVGTHQVVCWKPHVPQSTAPTPGRWTMTGTGFADLTLHPSVNVTGDWHGWIKAGQIEGGI